MRSIFQAHHDRRGILDFVVMHQRIAMGKHRFGEIEQPNHLVKHVTADVGQRTAPTGLPLDAPELRIIGGWIVPAPVAKPYRDDPAEYTVGQQVPQMGVSRKGSPVIRAARPKSGNIRRLHNLPRAAGIDTQRLFHQHMLARLQGGDSFLHMTIHSGGDVHRIGLGASQSCLHLVVNFRRSECFRNRFSPPLAAAYAEQSASRSIRNRSSDPLPDDVARANE